jgi:hypothetical protein
MAGEPPPKRSHSKPFLQRLLGRFAKPDLEGATSSSLPKRGKQKPSRKKAKNKRKEKQKRKEKRQGGGGFLR